MPSSSPLLAVEGVSAAWGSVPVLRSVSFELAAGELVVLLGPNGSGKTTLLRVIAGLERPTEGRVRLEGQDITQLPAFRRGVGLMLQEPALFPHRTVFENIAYAPLLKRRPRPEVDREVEELVSLLRLSGFEDRYPDRLSGGERQRVALARTLAARPKVVLLDEPFAAIDVEVRAELHAEFRRVLRHLGTAAVHVTHDREEGLFLGDRVGLLFDGRLETIGAPQTVFSAPGTARAASFLGYNVLAGPDGPVAVHPADLYLEPTAGPGPAATVVAAGTTGRGTLLVARTDDGQRVDLLLADPAARFVPGYRGSLRWTRSIPLRSESAPGPPQTSTALA